MDKRELIKKIEEEVSNCRKCSLWATRKNPVPGSGSVYTSVMLVGEAPGFHEDLQGKPFVGAAGKYLDQLLSIAGLKRENVYITNVLKCRPPGNREPQPNEIKACTPYLDRQIEIIEPKVIIALGNYAASYLLEKYGFKPASIGRIHGKPFRTYSLLGELIIVPMYHPCLLYTSPSPRDRG